MIKVLPRSSPELLLLLELNHPHSRVDPWNPVPHIMSIVERADQVYLCMEGLSEFGQPPLLNVAQYLDFFRQILEVRHKVAYTATILNNRAQGLTFFHGQRVSGLRCLETSSLMVDFSRAPLSTSQAGSSEIFDRFTYPVRYYFVNYSAACRIPESLSNTTLKGESIQDSSFQKDIRECGTLLEQLLLDVSY